MSDERLINAVNKNYLDKVMDLAEESEVLATEDILDSRGMKLVAKGARISRALQEKLILRKLSKPLESSIVVEGGIDTKAIVSEARRISETIEPVTCMLKSAVAEGGSSPFQILAGAKIGNAMSMMLTITERGGETALSHSVMVSLVAICLAKQIGLNEKEQTVLALAGLLHDIGELYIEPEYLNSTKRLLPHEWRHVVVHPRIGQMLISELENYPAAVAQAVSEHHERFDGTGYPRQLAGKTISTAGQVLSVAEMVSGVFMKQDGPLKRAELALKIIPGEHARELISAVSSTLRVPHQLQPQSADMASSEVHKSAREISSCIFSALEETRRLFDSSSIQSRQGKDQLFQVLNQIHSIQRAFSSTGLYACMEDATGLFEAQNMGILFEAGVACRELKWRLCDVARNLALQSMALESGEADVLKPLITLLDQQL